MGNDTQDAEINRAVIVDAINLLDHAEEYGDFGSAMEARRVLKEEIGYDN